MDDRREDADGVAGFLDAGGSVRDFEQAGQTRGAAGADSQGDAVAGNGCGIGVVTFSTNAARRQLAVAPAGSALTLHH